ncbi:MAG: helix-turn-helix transcriptional regulator [Polyangiaceae bacterium]|nr:helix-turn-helix transcriptional regulator [Polyangiaceae bacterium]
MTTRRKTGKSSATRFLEDLAGRPLTFGSLVEAIRAGEGLTQAEFARQLGMSRSHLCDIEKGRKAVSLTRAAQLAKTLGYSEKQFVRLALQKLVDEAGLKLVVKVEAA